MKNDYYFHGSDLEEIQKKYGIKPEDITNFAANVNPLGISPKLQKELSNNLDIITTYPDRDYTNLKKVISEYASTNVENIHFMKLAMSMPRTIQRKRPPAADPLQRKGE
jgi:threonine-phosphate decarboxylase